jgi:hypothetical protein
MVFVNGHEINDVAKLAPSGGGHHLVHGKVDRMQDIAERLILHGREKPVVAVNHPFEAGAGVALPHLGGVDQRQLPKPRNSVARRRECLRVVQGRRRNPLLAVVKYVDVTGDARRVPVQRRGPGDIAFRIAARGEQAENVGLNLR